MTTQTTTLELASNSLKSWLRQQQLELRRRRDRRALNGKVERAYQRFASHNPQYAASLFDMYFLTEIARPLLERFLTTNPPTATELALVWYAQFPTVVPNQRQFSEATRVAAAFLRHLEAELHP